MTPEHFCQWWMNAKRRNPFFFLFFFNRKIIYYLFVCLDFNRTNSKFDEGLLGYSGSGKPFVIQTLFLCFGSLDHFFSSRFFGVLSHFSNVFIKYFLGIPIRTGGGLFPLYIHYSIVAFTGFDYIIIFSLFGNLTKRKYVIQLLG